MDANGEKGTAFQRCFECGTIQPPALTLNEMARVQATEVERIWPTPEGQDPVLRQLTALTEEVGEIARAVLKRSHASRTLDGSHKGLTVEQWGEEVALEIGQALGVLLGLAHQERVDLDARMIATLGALVDRPSIIQDWAT
jgi:NTP pyrophosphatase (non-canonical NTP hydrolase)